MTLERVDEDRFLHGEMLGTKFTSRKCTPKHHEDAIEFYKNAPDTDKDGNHNAGIRTFNQQRIKLHQKALEELKAKEKNNIFNKIKKLIEDTQYKSNTGYTARVTTTKDGKHVAKFFNPKGEHMKDADYTHSDPNDVHEFARDEMKVRSSKEKVDERILEPQGHENISHPIAKDSKEEGRIKKQTGELGNKKPLEIIAKLLAKG